jgi:hypothetical protein
MRKRLLLILIGFVLLSFTVSCLNQPNHGSMLDSNWGRAYETAKYNQILNPDAGKTLEPVEGLDGPAGVVTVDEYRKSFVTKEKQKFYLNMPGIIGQ